MKRDIDFLKAYTSGGKKEKIDSVNLPKKVFVISTIVNIAAVLAVLTCISFDYISSNNNLNELLDFIQNSETATKYYELKRIEPTFNEVQKYNTMLESAKDVVNSYPSLRKKEYAIITDAMPADMKILAIDYELGNLSITMQAKSSKDIPDYIERVKSQTFFDVTYYEGWNYDQDILTNEREPYFDEELSVFVYPNSEEIINDSYKFMINCVLKVEGEKQ